MHPDIHLQRTISYSEWRNHIPTVKSSKFLGIAVDEHLSFEQHVQDVGEKIRPLTYVLLSLKRSGIPVQLLSISHVSGQKSPMLPQPGFP